MKRRRQKFSYRVLSRAYAQAERVGITDAETVPDRSLSPAQRRFWKQYYALQRARGDAHRNLSRGVMRQARRLDKSRRRLR